MKGLFSGGRTTVHIMTTSRAPAAEAMRIAMPRTRAVPIAASPRMKRVSVQALPAMLL